MRHKTLLALAPALLALTACHSNGGYMSADPQLTYGPGVVEFPDPARVYLPQYRRDAMGMAESAAAESAMQYAVPAHARMASAGPSPVRIVTQRMDPSPVIVRQPPAVARPVAVASMGGMPRAANVEIVRGDGLRGHELVLDGPVAPQMGDIQVRGERMPAHMLPRTGGVTISTPPKGAPLPPPTSDRPFRETELIVTPGGVYTR